jgi:hypothetical protein
MPFTRPIDDSVIIPALNEDENIGRCIQGVLGRCDYRSYCGRRQFRQVEYAKRYPVLFIQSQRGCGIQMNMGASAASVIFFFFSMQTILETGWADAILSMLEDDRYQEGHSPRACRSYGISSCRDS